MERFGCLGILVNIARLIEHVALEEVYEAAWSYTLKANFFSAAQLPNP